jgi:hypothetical protein
MYGQETLAKALAFPVRDIVPIYLVWNWMLAYVLVMCGGHVVFAVHLICFIMVIWSLLVIICAGGALPIRLFEWRRMRSYSRLARILDPQSGEIAKADLRALYQRRQISDRREKVKSENRAHKVLKRNHFKKQCAWRGKVFEPQLGCQEFTDLMDRLSSIEGFSSLDDAMLNRIENLVALYFALRDCKKVSQFLSILFLYFKTHYSVSVSNLAAEYISAILEVPFDCQVGSFSPPKEEQPIWLKTLTSCRTNWSLIVGNEGFKKISRTLSLCLALGLCDASKLDFQLNGMKLFSVGAAAKHSTSFDMIDAALDTVVYFVEGGYACFEQKSLKPLLYGNIALESFETVFNKCLQAHEYARCGNLEKYMTNSVGGPMTENDYEALLGDAIDQCQTLIKTTKGVMESNILKRKMEQLRNWQATFRQTRVQGGLRESPYHIGIFGGTSVGKSTVANILMILTLMANGYAATDERIVTLNEYDKYMSNYRSYVNGILVDDIGNTKPDFVEKSPCSLILQLVNNVRMYANMAEADMKGKVSVEPRLVISTKNVKDGCATIYSHEPASITRRDHITLTVKVRPQFATHGMLDYRKVQKLCPHLYDEAQWRCPDLWTITVEQSFPVPSLCEGMPATVGWQVVADKEFGMMEDISIITLIRWLSQETKDFFENQRNIVRSQNNVAGKVDLCPTCRLQRPDVCRCTEAPTSTPSEVEPTDVAVQETSVSVPNAHPNRVIFREAPSSDVVPPGITVQEIPEQEDLEQTPSEVEWENTSQSNIDAEMSMVTCPNMGYTGYCAVCACHHYPKQRSNYSVPPIFDCQLGERLAHFIAARYLGFLPRLSSWFEYAEDRTVEWLVYRLDWLESSRWVVWTNWIPRSWLEMDWCKNLIWLYHKDELERRIRKAYWWHAFYVCLWLLLAVVINPIFFLLIIPNCYGFAGVINKEKDLLYDRVCASNEAMPVLFKTHKEKHIKWITGMCFAIAALYGITLVWKSLRVIPAAQGNLQPKTAQDIEERDSEVNPWAGVVVSPMPCTEKAKTTTPSNLQSLVESNLCHMEFEAEKDGKMQSFYCNAFFPKSNVVLIPKHMWINDSIKAKFTRHDPNAIGGNFSAYLYRGHSVDIPGSDLCLAWVPNGGDWRDLTHYLPTFKFHDVPARLVYKDNSGSVTTSRMLLKCGEVRTHAGHFFGASYTLDKPTFNGLCMAVVITETKGPLIGGFHLGGLEGEKHGCSGLLLAEDLTKAYEELQKKRSVVLSASSGTMPKELYDIQFYQGPEVHPKSAVNFLPVGSNCKYYGQVTGRATYHSEVEETVISPHVEDVCGVPQKWGGPKFRVGWPFQASLQHSTNPSIGMEGHLLDRAVSDYVRPILKALDELVYLRDDVRKLADMEVVCGIDGKRFIDKMPPGTSIGFPCSGPKRDHLTYLNPEAYPGFACPAELDSIFWDEAARMEQLYLDGERAYPMFKACLKDEPTKLTKDKVRVFQGAPIAMQLLVRKYYLPVARALSMLPLKSECAVGINAQGPEWDRLARYVRRFGQNRILAGDYSKYDLRMPAQVMFAAFRVMMDIAEHCGYSEDDLVIMRGIASDICYPLMAYNGDLIQHFGSNPSGHNLTVYINSIVNSLLFRCAYFHICAEREDLPDFREVCSLITYGDDAKSSVRKDFPEFNHISVAEFLDDHDMKFTMPDKESTPVPYMTDEDADLLKRKNVFSEDTGMIMGALEEDSIFKSLHATLKSSALTKEQQSMQNIGGALREWFGHGRAKYDKRLEQMKEVADRAEISHGIPDLSVTYDERLAAWKEKYE